MIRGVAGPSTFADYRAERNRAALARLDRVQLRAFPPPVVTHALAKRFIPASARLAVDSYWRAHPLRADRLARALASQTGAPPKWTWRLGKGRKDGLPVNFRQPPAPFRERKFSRGPGFCCVCGQPVYHFGWHRDLWDAGPNRRAAWHSACVSAWQLWTAPAGHGRMLRRLQDLRCAQTGGRLWKTAEIDHRARFASGEAVDVARDHLIEPHAGLFGRDDKRVLRGHDQLARLATSSTASASSAGTSSCKKWPASVRTTFASGRSRSA